MEVIFSVFFALSDLIVQRLPFFKKGEGFAFLVHPRDITDVYRKYPFFRKFSPAFSHYVLSHFWPVTLSRVTGVKKISDGKDISGWVISIPITAEQMMHDRDLARKFIIKAARLAERKGASMTGLGALTASLTRGGTDIKPHIRSFITTGRLFTAKVIVDTAEEALELVKDAPPREDFFY